MKLRILHISDLHERAEFPGMPPERATTVRWDANQRGMVLGIDFYKTLQSMGAPAIDMVCFTGDLADWGHPEEYKKATARIDTILNTVNVPRNRFFAVPGNHDVQRHVSEEAWKGVRKWLAETPDTSALGRWFFGVTPSLPGLDPRWRQELLHRTSAFWEWSREFYGEDLRLQGGSPLGYRKTLGAGTLDHVPQTVHVIGLDSAWLCGAEEAHDGTVFRDQGSIRVTEEQVLAHVRDREQGLAGFRIALLHHPLAHLADDNAVRRLLGQEGVDILLHGHQHEPLTMVADEPGARLRIFASGCLIEGGIGKNYPNGFQLIEVDVATHSGTMQFRKWSANGNFWANGSDLYRDAPSGVLPFGANPDRETSQDDTATRDDELTNWWKSLSTEWREVFERNIGASIGSEPSPDQLNQLIDLVELKCHEIKVQNLGPLRRLKRLERIYCDGTLIRGLEPLSDLPKLSFLDCSRTPVSNLRPLHAISSLKVLVCIGTRVSEREMNEFTTRHLLQVNPGA